MAKNKESALITPVLTKDVSFNEKVDAVDQALKSRTTAQKNIKTKWAKIVQLLVSAECTVPARRVDASSAAMLVNNVQVYVQKPKPIKEYDVYMPYGYNVNDLLNKSALTKELEKDFKGLRLHLEKIVEEYNRRNASKEVDETKTKELKKSLQKAVDEYILAIEAYDDTVESVANVKEYISVVKDVAEISAIAQGMLPTNTK